MWLCCVIVRATLSDKITAGRVSNGCVYPQPGQGLTGASCPTGCSSYINTAIVQDEGCCLNAWLYWRQRYGDVTANGQVSSLQIVEYINTTCSLNVPAGCARGMYIAHCLSRTPPSRSCSVTDLIVVIPRVPDSCCSCSFHTRPRKHRLRLGQRKRCSSVASDCRRCRRILRLFTGRCRWIILYHSYFIDAGR